LGKKWERGILYNVVSRNLKMTGEEGEELFATNPRSILNPPGGGEEYIRVSRGKGGRSLLPRGGRTCPKMISVGESFFKRRLLPARKSLHGE